VTTEQESKLPAAAGAGADREGAAVAPAVGTLDDEAGAEEEDEAGAEEDDEAQAASKIAAQVAKAEIATGRRSTPAPLTVVTKAEPTRAPVITRSSMRFPVTGSAVAAAHPAGPGDYRAAG
jgi:hypothetical protein